MKRTLSVLCTAALLFLLWLHEADSRGSGPLDEAAAGLTGLQQRNGAITVRGTVEKCERISAGVRLSVNHLSIQEKKTSVISLSSDWNLTVTTKYETIRPGDSVCLRGKFYAYEEASNPGEFDAREYYQAQDSLGQLRNAELLSVRKGPASLASLAFVVREALQYSYSRILPERAARTVSAISLGEKSRMEREWKQQYQEGGIAHILAVSGLHISLIGMACYRLLRKIGRGFRSSALFSSCILFFYLLLSGFGISAQRAALMFFIWLGAEVCGRKYDMITGISVSALILCMGDARRLYQASFLLSFSAVLSLAVLPEAVSKSCQIRSRTGKALLTSLAVWFGTLPFLAWFFFQSAPWSILVNLAVVPLMSVLMTSGFAAACAGLVCVPAGVFLAAPVRYLLDGFDWLCRAQQRLPFPVWISGRPEPWKIALYYTVILCMVFLTGNKVPAKIFRKIFRKRKEKSGGRSKWTARALWLFAGAFCLLLLSVRERKELQIDCLDVGQGDCALVRLPGGENCLIDGGSSSEDQVWEYVIDPALRYYGISELDYVFLSHADADHMNGVEAYVASCEPGAGGRNVHGISVKNIVLPPCADSSDFLALRQKAKEKGIRILRLEAGGRITEKAGKRETQPWEILCLAPDEDRLTGERNEDSMVLMLTYGEFRMLFTGDLEEGAERALAGSGADLQADVLKVGHHGSAGASSKEFLSRVRPQLAVISCGKNNRYGHPAREAVERLEAAGSTIFVTAECGAVSITTNGRTFAVKKCRKL